jgi:hypothetical protein
MMCSTTSINLSSVTVTFFFFITFSTGGRSSSLHHHNLTFMTHYICALYLTCNHVFDWLKCVDRCKNRTRFLHPIPTTTVLQHVTCSTTSVLLGSQYCNRYSTTLQYNSTVHSTDLLLHRMSNNVKHVNKNMKSYDVFHPGSVTISPNWFNVLPMSQ